MSVTAKCPVGGVRCVCVCVTGVFESYSVSVCMSERKDSLTISVSNGHEFLHLISILHHEAGEVLHVNSNVRSHMNLQFPLHRLAQQVTHLLIVQLQVGHPHQEPGNGGMETSQNG